ncbi:MAG: biotin--[acetyl-CoA-carboxylase] ligase [Clostridia bacterium]|nr:biotin--[acetyl-CoA-carboxylase] ligase [Clostridia bacterium]MDR3644591.1 biotin--[acetyl-CoA-carboxylase] ligase [Clostridia bacterium]
MPDRDRLARLLNTEYFGKALFCLKRIDSTNDFLKSRAAELPSGAAALADEQPAGRGRRGNVWLCAPGEAVAMSILVKPVEVAAAPLIAPTCGLAAAKALNSLCGGGFLIKWPNDLVFAGKKIGGILCESICSGGTCSVVCGFGINLMQNEAYFESCGLPFATSILVSTGAAPAYEDVAAAILNAFEALYGQTAGGGSAGILSEYSQLCVTLGRPVRVFYPDKTVTGIASAVNPDGSLTVKTAQGDICVNSGEVSVRGVMGYS